MRGRGIGKVLYDYAVEYARENGYYNLTLNVWACNPSAMRFYEKCGLKVQKVGMELVLSGLIMHSVVLRKFFCGKPVILINNGKIIQENLRRTRITLDELTGHLREKDVLDIRTVQYAILETDGNLSVFPFPKERPASAKDAGIQASRQYLPITLVEDGYLSKENLQKAGKDETWVKTVLQQHNTDVQSTLLLTVDEGDHVVWLGKEPK